MRKGYCDANATRIHPCIFFLSLNARLHLGCFFKKCFSEFSFEAFLTWGNKFLFLVKFVIPSNAPMTNRSQLDLIFFFLRTFQHNDLHEYCKSCAFDSDKEDGNEEEKEEEECGKKAEEVGQGSFLNSKIIWKTLRKRTLFSKQNYL